MIDELKDVRVLVDKKETNAYDINDPQFIAWLVKVFKKEVLNSNRLHVRLGIVRVLKQFKAI